MWEAIYTTMDNHRDHEILMVYFRTYGGRVQVSIYFAKRKTLTCDHSLLWDRDFTVAYEHNQV